MFRKKEHDVEQPLFPNMQEDPALRWGFIRKVYSLVLIQLVVTVAVGAFVVWWHPIAEFISQTWTGIGLYIGLVVFLVICSLGSNYLPHPWNYVAMGLLNLGLALVVGLACSFENGKVVLEAMILTATVVIALTLYTFYAVKRGQDFSFLGPFLFAALIVIFVFVLVQVFFPLGKLGSMIWAGIFAIVYCALIVYDTESIIRRHSYDEYMLSSVTLYLDILNILFSLLTLVRGSNA